MGLEKAKIITESKEEIVVLFNPTEYSLTSGANYSEKVIPGLDGPITQFIAGQADTLTVSLIFDTYSPPTLGKPQESGTDVSIETNKIVKLTQIKGDLHRPPIITFQWGALNFKGTLQSVNHNYTMFMPNGMPVRAKMELSLKSLFDLNLGKRQSPFESPDRTKVRVIHEKQQLWQLAYEEYQDVEKWKEIASTNKITNPLDIYPGQVVKLPAL